MTKLHRLSAAVVSAIICVLLQTHSLAGTIRHDVPDIEYVELGSDANYESVGILRWIESGSDERGSAVLISPQWAVATAHSIDNAEEITFEIGVDVYDADDWIPYPDWSNSPSPFTQKLLEGTDIALIHLSTAVEDVSPATLYAGSDEFESLATIVGSGLTGTGLTGAFGTDTEKRAGTNTLDLVFGPGERILGMDFDNPVCETNPSDQICDFLPVGENSFGSAQPSAYEFLPIFGDSGGGVFLDVDGEAQLAGIVSFFGSGPDGIANGAYGDTAGITRVSQFVDWIQSELITGDFDQDGFLTSADIDLLTAEILDGEPFDSQFDLNSDGVVNNDDRDFWIQDLKETRFGDANFDNNVNASDLNDMALNWQSSNRTWAGGDFDGSGFVDSGDLNMLGLNWQFVSAAASPVPESIPQFWIWLVLTLALRGTAEAQRWADDDRDKRAN